LSLQGQFDRNLEATALPIARSDRSAMLLDDSFGDGQPEPRSRLVRREVRLEDSVEMIRCNARPLVLDLQQDVFALVAKSGRHASTRLRCTDRVLDQRRARPMSLGSNRASSTGSSLSSFTTTPSGPCVAYPSTISVATSTKFPGTGSILGIRL